MGVSNPGEDEPIRELSNSNNNNARYRDSSVASDATTWGSGDSKAHGQVDLTILMLLFAWRIWGNGLDSSRETAVCSLP